MTGTMTEYAHIVLNERGIPIIAGTRMKVKLLVAAQQAYGVTAEELQAAYPDLTLGQIHSALAYYYDHKPDLDIEIENDLSEYDRRRREMPASPVVERLRRLKTGDDQE